ncbi:D-cysteine desulfhydrase family protein [Kutzneria sp. CA-103260]|uniref:D-cysteine desulfhydrase family protein n=1 Tax=Kutzneria sp. CA-103260 TaxID=2802641 RepID=UPI001BA67523|nr:D-cysteine desulfhydrase family protein [Kutzneria sp. CA-103260]QUQ67880.1 1-aminocyclopropane-1-carboxylate deaminase [Kutzneria sp. CA-103260]
MATDLSSFPRIRLGQWPSPLQACPRLSDRLGTRVLVKRDDVSLIGVGGNKLRKLEFLLGAAVRDGAERVVTFGAVQTNHGRLTAAACARLGLACDLVLTRAVPRDGEAYERSGNILLDRVYGATVHVLDTDEQAEVRHQELLAAHGKTVSIPVGGSTGVGALGYVQAVAELIEQFGDTGVWPSRLVAPLASAGTAAGLVVGAAAFGWEIDIDLIAVSRPVEAARQVLSPLIEETAALLDIAPPSLDRVRITDRTLGPGYGQPTEDVWRAISLFGSTEAITLEPVYSGKTAAGMVSLIGDGSIAADETVLFLHTGGLPGLFAYTPEATAALSD